MSFEITIFELQALFVLFYEDRLYNLPHFCEREDLLPDDYRKPSCSQRKQLFCFKSLLLLTDNLLAYNHFQKQEVMM